MKIRNSWRGFTLIELLVVVLIIGILAAIAVPQYNKAVMKARVVEYEINLKSLADAANLCKLQNGTNCSIGELDIAIPECNVLTSQANSCAYQIDNNGNPVIQYRVSAYTYTVFGYNMNPRSFDYMASYENGRPTFATVQVPSGMYCNNQYVTLNCGGMGFNERIPLRGDSGGAQDYVYFKRVTMGG